MTRTRRWMTAAFALMAFAPSAARAGERFKFNAILDGRVVTATTSTSFLDGGLGKTRYGHQPRTIEAKLAQAAFLVQAELRPDLTLRAQANVDAEHDFRRRADLIEGLIRYTPAIGDAAALDIRAGVFFPAVSLENTEMAWLSPYTTTFSAINSWIGEEVRSVGAEAGPSFRIEEAQVRLFGAVTRGNDPNGTLLAWRGFAMHDRVSGFSDRLPLPALRSFAPHTLFPDQPPHVQPMREVDRNWTWSTGFSVTHPQYRIRALYQPRTANPGAFDGEQYAWRTGYWAVGAARSLGRFELLAQGLDGETRMGILAGGRNVIVAKFQAAYLMASWTDSEAARHRLTARYDVFRVRDRDDYPVADPNDESGSAWAFAYSFAPSARHRISAEVVRVDGTRSNRRDLGLEPRATDVLGTLSWRLIF